MRKGNYSYAELCAIPFKEDLAIRLGKPYHEVADMYDAYWDLVEEYLRAGKPVGLATYAVLYIREKAQHIPHILRRKYDGSVWENENGKETMIYRRPMLFVGSDFRRELRDVCPPVPPFDVQIAKLREQYCGRKKRR